MIKGFAEQSGGAVTIDSTVGKGTTVSIYLPALESERRTEEAEQGSFGEGLSHGRGERISPEKAFFAGGIG